ncbi:hypothetical protein ESZ50_00625 [Weissella muntiaci]|uniref:Uncharacterized protein n=1 Tax=Weissella muntiaci TaxID=2508881 RepID=A0A6C2CA94_9LACO|nr:hypothetical protein [Weissella muntiaci]TYC51071.1 hypothetical protein ESZ50_00625 [Weissella muntiaci]
MTKKEQSLFDFLIEWVTDKATAYLFINGGYNGYVYGSAGYVEDPDDEYWDEQVKLGAMTIEDAILEHRYLIGSVL